MFIPMWLVALGVVCIVICALGAGWMILVAFLEWYFDDGDEEEENSALV